MDFLKEYVSDTSAGSSNQTWVAGDGHPLCGRVYYRLRHGGDAYRLLFSDMIDSTFADGAHSRANDVCGGFEILSMRAGLCDRSDTATTIEPAVWHTVTFDGEASKTVNAGESAVCDPVRLCAEAGATLCIELCVQGERLPCHAELQVASFVKTPTGFVPSTQLPVPSLVAVKREAMRLGFLGDSITQGIGATPNSYRHWVARLGERLPLSVAVWNLGIGFARSGDVASDGVWLRKAMQNDAVVVCLGVNDLLRGVPIAETEQHLRTVVHRLREKGVRVLLQSVPPFEFSPEVRENWRELNAHLRELAAEADGFFDVVPLLCGEDGVPRYGGHPNDEGCAVWADALGPVLEAFLEDGCKTARSALY